MPRQHTHYDNLKVSRNAPPEVIRAAYKALSQRYHPDKNSSPDATRIMKILNEAYDVLGDAERRQRYDASLVDDAHEQAGSATDYARRDESSQAKAKESEPKRNEENKPPPFTADVRPIQRTARSGAGWFWIVGIAVAVIIRIAVSSSNDTSGAQIATPPSYASDSPAAPAALSGAPGAEESKNVTSFDCKKAHLTSEKLICDDAELASLDLDLATIFAQAKATAPDKRRFAESARRAWNWRNTNCFDKSCLVTWYSEQRERLTALLNQSAEPMVAPEAPIASAALPLPSQTEGESAAQTTSVSPDAAPSTGYAERVSRRVRPNIVWAGDDRGLETVITVHVGRAGALLSSRILRSSGNPAWDAAALRAVELSNPMPVDVSGEAPTSFTITLSPNRDTSTLSQSGRDHAIAWAHAVAQQHDDANAAYDMASQELAEIGASCPDTVLLQQSPQNTGPYKPVVMFLSQQCGYMVGYWPESGEQQISFERSTIENWSAWCSMSGGTKTSCVRNNGA